MRGWLTGKESVRDGWGGWEGSGLCEIGEDETENDERVRELGLTACGRVNERAKRWRAVCEWEMKKERRRVAELRVYLYLGVRGFNFFFFFKCYICIRVGSGLVCIIPGSDLNPFRVFFKTQTCSICFTDQVKPAPWGSGRTGYPRVEPILPSLQNS